MNTELWDLEDWQAAYDERAAILEYDEGLPRQHAEAVATRWVVEHRGSFSGIRRMAAEWRRRKIASS